MLALIPFIQLAFEASEVIGLRLFKFASGSPDAMTEVELMISEKVDAAVEAGVSIISGHSPVYVVERYREHVANNHRRLSK